MPLADTLQLSNDQAAFMDMVRRGGTDRLDRRAARQMCADIPAVAQLARYYLLRVDRYGFVITGYGYDELQRQFPEGEW